jgi:hypothetical protein
MGIFDLFNKKKEPIIEARTGYQRELFSIFDGEKNAGELGALINYDLDYAGLRLRSWESYLSSEITQTVVSRFSMWVIGSGLKLQSEPISNILEHKNIQVPQALTKTIESSFRIFANSNKVDFSEKKNLHQIAKTLFINTIVGGDMLVILRLEDLEINIQLIDGAMVVDPIWGDYHKQAESLGHTIKNGIESDKRGRNVAFFVKTDTFKVERILSHNPDTGRETAFMVYGSEYRISDNRGLPKFSAVLETLKKLDRYKEAVVGKVEEEAKVVLSIEHDLLSTGENPLLENLAQSFNAGGSPETPSTIEGKPLQDKVAAATNKRVVNLPQGAKLKSFEPSSSANYKEFYSPNVNSICATVGIPPEVALSKYDSNFSSARAALKDWEHTLGVTRKDFSNQFYDKVYEYWLDIEVLKQNIQAEGYVNALAQGDKITLAAYRNSRFVGANVPHIDPVKEVQAERLKMGTTGDTIPLTTSEAATEALNGGDSDANFKRYSEELKETKKLEIIAAPINVPIDNNLKKKQD